MTTQSHIHLDLPENLGGAPEGAPLATYGVTERLQIPEFRGSVQRSLTGRPFFGAVAGSDGKPRIFRHFRYTLLVSSEQEDLLGDLLGSAVLLVDNRHPNDGEDHSGAIRAMRVMEVKHVRDLGPLLDDVEVSIYLEENRV